MLFWRYLGKKKENLTQISVVLTLFTSNEISNDYESVKCSIEIEQNLPQGLSTLTLRIQISRGSLFWA